MVPLFAYFFAFLNLGMAEMVVILVVAIVVFGRNLPSVAVQAAANVAKLKRSLTDLRRETGIDEEIRKAQREFEDVIPRDIPSLIERKLESTIEAEAPPKPSAAESSREAEGDSSEDVERDAEETGSGEKAAD